MQKYYLILEQNKIIETERLILRPITLTDADNIFEYSKDIENIKFLEWPPHQDIAETKNIIAQLFLNQPLGKWALELKDTHQMIGIIDLRLDSIMPNAKMGYIVNKKYWGNGYIVEAGKAVITLAFKKMQLKWVFAECDIENTSSERAMLKMGMEYLGILPCQVTTNYGQNRSHKNYGIKNVNII
ncbi:GNAT family N-acetyltransferase [Spiroplasma sp. SV19]|uniref:GNAT family N-acetyltransferase n=1 Tax=Spiroplasma sp. SV19 TaxID=2570468 RepID=UPI0024B7AC7F|nr:GNAT family N-acetyltransferase [Spiroplasma sp. SV19]WHQ37166.1 GNAT family N-acetyltransferase [Spiroplasma sp. SV19]